MDENRYLELIHKLDSLVEETESDNNRLMRQQVSPTTTLRLGSNAPQFYIHKELDLEELTYNQKLMLHTMLHKLYKGNPKGVTKQELKDIHDKLKLMLNKHFYFDILDD